MRVILERHGGTVEKFIGDAVMAVFGIPVAHEDDALRAVKAAIEMRARLAELNEELARERGLTLAVRTGINTGEVVAGARKRKAAHALVGSSAARATASVPTGPPTPRRLQRLSAGVRLRGLRRSAERDPVFARRWPVELSGR
jgi:hypothetical protein